MLKIGLTGGIGSGKSTVGNTFSDLGIPLIDLDKIAREVVQPETPCLKAIVEHFGAEILNSDLSLDRDVLRGKIFNEPDEKIWLENLLHPAIRKRYLEQERHIANKADTPYLIIEIPLLNKNQDQYQLDRILVVDISKEKQIERTMQRSGLTKNEVEKIIDSQTSREERLTFADDIIDNEGSEQELRQKVAELDNKYLQLAAIKTK